MPTIKNNFDKIQKKITDTALACGRHPDTIHLIAVSKKKSVETILKGIDAGARHFGENYIQEAVEKIDRIKNNDIYWHFIGHLQSNKAKVAVQYFEYIHTVDTIKLAKAIHQQAKKIDKIQKLLIQVNISEEKTKSGTGVKEVIDLVNQINTFENLSLQGLMCMPPYFSNPENARIYFKQLFEIKEKILSQKLDTISMEHLSMGMSNDFKVAIEEGATMVRIGTSLFGDRD